jgi:16S rRNA (guanine527-N7)-methyltransferase
VPENDTRRRIQRRATKANVEVDPAALDGLVAYFDLLVTWNRRMNLTSLTDADAAVDRLLIEPLVAARWIPVEAMRLLDVGSGGGSPAIPLKLAVPRLAVWMVESKVRKSAFLREVTRQLALGDVVVETSRFEELLVHPHLVEAMDVVSMRAVRLDPEILRHVASFVRADGLFFYFTTDHGQLPASLFPFRPESSDPLVEALRSRLLRLRKVDDAEPVSDSPPGTEKDRRPPPRRRRGG